MSDRAIKSMLGGKKKKEIYKLINRERDRKEDKRIEKRNSRDEA